MTKIKKDKYRRARGGYSRLLSIKCEQCGSYLLDYQKDGPGILMRLYLDRIRSSSKYSGQSNKLLKEVPNLQCANCRELIGVPYIFKKEKRLAYKLFVGTITKRIIKIKK